MNRTPALVADVRVRRDDFVLDVSVTIEPGEVVLLTGDNGAGKSTLVRAIAGGLPIDEGCITVDGRVVDEPGTRTFIAPEGRGIGVVHQDARPFGHMTAVDNVAFGLRARGVRRSAARAAALAQLEVHGLTELADRRGVRMSGGEGRRIVLARTLVVRPGLLLLDEPLSAIDTGARDAVVEVLRSVTAQHSAAVLLVTHDPEELGALADREIRLRTGELLRPDPGPVV